MNLSLVIIIIVILFSHYNDSHFILANKYDQKFILINKIKCTNNCLILHKSGMVKETNRLS